MPSAGPLAKTKRPRVRLLRLIDPRRSPFWWFLFASGLLVRVYAVLYFRNPSDALFSDPWRHWDNAEHFLKPGLQGASNPYFYQLYLFIVQQVTHEDRRGIGLITAGLSVSYPLVWYLFGRSVFCRGINALRFATILCWLPSHISMFGFFMNETLLLPLMGLCLWLTQRTIRRGTPGSFVGMATTWTLGVLTRSVVGPLGLACVLGSWLRLGRRRWLALAAASAIAFVCVAVVSVRAHRVLKRYTPFGDNVVVAIYFVSGARDYTIDVKNYGSYVFSSPSLYLSPFYPFSEFQTIRQGVVAITMDPDLGGRDIQKTLREEAEKNRGRLPRLIFENFVYFTFGHSWPAAGAVGGPADAVCVAERWIWFPLILVSCLGSIVYVVRRRAAFVPLLVIGFAFTCYVVAQVTIMEGRYRKPLEPLVVLAPIWLWDARRRTAVRRLNRG